MVTPGKRKGIGGLNAAGDGAVLDTLAHNHRRGDWPASDRELHRLAVRPDPAREQGATVRLISRAAAVRVHPGCWTGDSGVGPGHGRDEGGRPAAAGHTAGAGLWIGGRGWRN